MTVSDLLTIWIASISVIGGLAGFVITHLLNEIKRLNSRVEEIYNILLDRQLDMALSDGICKDNGIAYLIEATEWLASMKHGKETTKPR